MPKQQNKTEYDMRYFADRVYNIAHQLDTVRHLGPTTRDALVQELMDLHQQMVEATSTF